MENIPLITKYDRLGVNAIKEFVLNFDSRICELEKENKWNEVAISIYQYWLEKPTQLDHVLCAGTELWYTRLIMDYIGSHPTPPSHVEVVNNHQLECMLMEITRFGLDTFGNNSSFNAYFGYMIKVMPHFFLDYNGDYKGWQKKGISMMRYSYTLDPQNPLAKAMFYEPDYNNEAAYNLACEELWQNITPEQWGYSEVQKYFFYILNGDKFETD